MSDSNKKPGFVARIIRSLKDMAGELKKVVWPTRKQMVNNTLIVLAFMVIAAICVGLIDTAFITAINKFLQVS